MLDNFQFHNDDENVISAQQCLGSFYYKDIERYTVWLIQLNKIKVKHWKLMNIRIYKFDAVESYFAKHIIVYLKMKDYCNECYSPR